MPLETEHTASQIDDRQSAAESDETTPSGISIADLLIAARSQHGFAWVGLTENEAAAQAADQGVSFRVIKRDGTDQPVTRDLRPGRINATIHEGHVMAVSIEPAGSIVEGTTDVRGIALLGMPADLAVQTSREQGMPLRIVSVDGQTNAMTMDYMPDRLNATIINGVVVALTNG